MHSILRSGIEVCNDGGETIRKSCNRSSDEGNDDYGIVSSTLMGKMRFRLGTEPVDLPTNFPITKDSALSDTIGN